MTGRQILFEKAHSASTAAFAKTPYMFPLESVIEQLRYLLDIESGLTRDMSKLTSVNIGEIAARDIESLDPFLADLLHEVSAQVRGMLQA